MIKHNILLNIICKKNEYIRDTFFDKFSKNFSKISSLFLSLHFRVIVRMRTFQPTYFLAAAAPLTFV